MTEFNTTVVKPILYKYCSANDQQVEVIAPRITALIVMEGKSTLDFSGLNDSWHKAGNRIPDHLRPYLLLDSWKPLFKGEIDLGEGFTIRDLHTPQELAEESKSLLHCVGYGSYGQSCAVGTTHILSIRENGRPVATLELSKFGRGQSLLKDGAENDFYLAQFKGKNNSNPTNEAQAAWSRFLSLIVEKEIELSSEHGIDVNQNTASVSNRERAIGYPLDKAEEILPQILSHYFQRVRIQKNKGGFVSLIPDTPLETMISKISREWEQMIEAQVLVDQVPSETNAAEDDLDVIFGLMPNGQGEIVQLVQELDQEDYE